MPNGNGSTKILLAIIGGLTLALIGAFGAWNQERNSGIEKLSATDKELITVDKELSRRIGELEQKYAGIDEKLKSIKDGMDRLLGDRGQRKGL